MDIDRKFLEEIMYLLEEVQDDPDVPGASYEQRLFTIMADLRRMLYASTEGKEGNPLNKYEEKQERRRDRLLDRADKAQAESDRRWKASSDAVAHIPLGQPILVGHHSERGHRADLARCHRHADKSLEEHNKANEYRRRADAVGKGGISSDDPNAIAKLGIQLDNLKRKRDQMKAINKAWRKAGKPKADQIEAWQAIEDETGEDLTVVRPNKVPGGHWHPQPFAAYELTNLNANIRRIEQRIEDLEKRETEPEREDYEAEGFTVHEDKDDNRIHFEFDEKPPKQILNLMRMYGFKWSPTRGCHVRQLINAGRAAADYLKREVPRVMAELKRREYDTA